MAELSDFFGSWVLVPQRSDFGPLPAPRRACYTVLPSVDSVAFFVEWIDAEGGAQRTHFRCPSDATPVTLEDGVTLHMGLGSDALITEFRSGSTAIHTTTHSLTNDATTLVVAEERRDDSGGWVATTSVYERTRVKQVMVYRRDLKMRKGKIAAQCAHASSAVFFQRHAGHVEQLVVDCDGPMASWLHRGSAKVVLSVDNETDLANAHRLALEAMLPTALITDSGRTEFKGIPTRTAVALGPAPVAWIDAITGPGGAVPTKLA